MAHSAEVKKLLDHLQSDLKNISLEAKRRHPGVKESAEEAIVKEGTTRLVIRFNNTSTTTGKSDLTTCEPGHTCFFLLPVALNIRNRPSRAVLCCYKSGLEGAGPTVCK